MLEEPGNPASNKSNAYWRLEFRRTKFVEDSKGRYEEMSTMNWKTWNMRLEIAMVSYTCTSEYMKVWNSMSRPLREWEVTDLRCTLLSPGTLVATGKPVGQRATLGWTVEELSSRTPGEIGIVQLRPFKCHYATRHASGRFAIDFVTSFKESIHGQLCSTKINPPLYFHL